MRSFDGILWGGDLDFITLWGVAFYMSSVGRGLMCWKWVFIWFFYCKITCVVAMIIHQLLSVSHNQNICIPPLYKSFFYACAIKQRCCVLIKRKIKGKRTAKSFDLYFTEFFLFENRTQTLSERNRICMSRIISHLKCKTLIAKNWQMMYEYCDLHTSKQVLLYYIIQIYIQCVRCFMVVCLCKQMS